MTRFQIALALGLAMPGIAMAQVPAKPAATAATPALPAIPGVSPQGMAVIARIQKQGDPIGQSALVKMRALLPQVSQTALAPTVDVEKFGGLLKQQDVLAAQIQSRRTEVMIAILRQLPATDRGPFLRAIATKLPSQGPAPAQGR